MSLLLRSLLIHKLSFHPFLESLDSLFIFDPDFFLEQVFTVIELFLELFFLIMEHLGKPCFY
jgi:hypothetical protein